MLIDGVEVPDPPANDTPPKANDQIKLPTTLEELKAFEAAAVTKAAAGIKESERKKLEKAQADAKAAELLEKQKADGEKDKVITTYEAKLAALEAKTAQSDALSTRFNTLVDSEIKDWPASLKALDPGPENVQVRTDWYEKAKVLAAEMKPGTGRPPNTQSGNGNNTNNAPNKNAAEVKVLSQYKGIPGQPRR